MSFLWSIVLVAVANVIAVSGRPEGYHFTKFYGPVSGPVTPVEVPNDPHKHHAGHKPSFDYVAKPDYSFAYGVEDPKSGNFQNQKEYRDGDVVKGEYTVIEADGSTRRVVYTADPKNGFQATVHMSEPNRQYAATQENYVRALNENHEHDNGYHGHENDYN